MTDTMLLPPAFADLAPFAGTWARPTENARSEIRWSAGPADFAAFYGAVMPRLPDMLDYLATVPLDGMDEAQANLFSLAAAFAEAAPHHELYGGSPDVPFSFSARRFVPGHGDTPSWDAARH
ncbi:MAG: hypothetical protein RIQ46_249 [Pseudomonadota bacterium]